MNWSLNSTNYEKTKKLEKQETKLEKICKKYDDLLVKNENDTLKLYKVINWKKHLIGYANYSLEEDYFWILEFVTANFHKYSYSKHLFKVLFVSEKDFIDKINFEKNDFSYLWTYILKYLMDIAKQKQYKLAKIINPDDWAVEFYHKALNTLKEEKIIKNFSYPRYEKFDKWPMGIYQIKVINIKL